MAVLVETMDSIYVETEFAFSSNLSKRGIGDDLGGELVLKTGEDYIPPDIVVTPNKHIDQHLDQCPAIYRDAPSPESISIEGQIQVDGELVLKTGENNIPPGIVVKCNKIHFVDKHFEQQTNRAINHQSATNNRIKVWHFP